MASAWLRTTRAGRAQITSASTVAVVHRLGPRKVARTITSGRNGSVRTTSVTRISSASSHPPAVPATAPTAVPIATAAEAATRPIVSEVAAPASSSESRSWPMSLVPSQCWALGGRYGAATIASGS